MLRHNASLSRYLASTTRVPLKAINEVTEGYSAPVKVGQVTLQMPVDLMSGFVWIKCGELPQVDAEACQDFCPGTSMFRKQYDGKYCVTPVEEPYSIGDLEIPDGVLSIAQDSKTDGPSYNQLGLSSINRDLEVSDLFKTIDSFSLSLASSDPFLLFGGVDQSLIDKEGLKGYTFPVDKSSEGWSMPFTSLQLGDDKSQIECQPQEDSPCLAWVSSRHRFVSVASKVYHDFEHKYLLPANCEMGTAEGTLCDASIASKLPRFTLVFGDKTFYLETEDYVKPSATPGKVIVQLRQSSGENTWGLGLAFLRKYYSYYDFSKNQLTLYCNEGKTCDSNSSVSPGSSAGNDASTPGLNKPSDDSENGKVASSSESGSKTGMYVGIACGVVALLVILFILRMVYRKKVKKREQDNTIKSTPIEGESSQTVYTTASMPQPGVA